MAFTSITKAVERISGVSPSPFGFGVENGRAQMLLTIPAEHLLPAMRETLGYTTVSGIGLQRQLPMAHPMFPWLFCERVSNGQGVQFAEKRSSTGVDDSGVVVDLEADPFPYYARYKNYELALEFLPRPYAVVSDSQMQRKTIEWWDIDTPAANPLSFEVQTEWWRFVELDQQPAGDYITAAQGAFLFRMDSNPTGFSLQNLAIPTGQLKLYISSKSVKFRWYQVPFAWLLSENSYFDKYTGRLNQYEFYGYPKGTLLLNSVDVMRVYTQPFPEFVPYNGAFLPSQQKLCDLQFTCVYRNPPLAKPYTPGGTESKNNIVGGHNLIPCHIDNKFYYGTNENNKLAIYPSVPFEIFFRNPDA